MKIDVIVLAGARNNDKLKDVSDTPHEALIPIHGRPMVDFVFEALRDTPAVGSIGVVGPEDLRPYLDPDMELIPAGDKYIDNIMRGVRHFSDRDRILLVTADIPFIHRPALEDFLERCGDRTADIYYPVVSQEANEKRFPGVRRTYFTVKEGTFTGGNIMLVSTAAMVRCQPTVEKIVDSRKKPWEMFRLLGPVFILRALFKKLALRDIERRVKKLVDVVGVTVISPYPEIGTDVDKPSDWELACQQLAKEQPGRKEEPQCEEVKG